LYAILLSFLCLAIHEIGHAAAGLFCGGSVREFALLSPVPHVRLDGTFSAAQASWIALAGSLSELLLFLAAAWARAGIAVEVTGAFAAIELVGWTLAALLFPGGPRDNDGWDFLAQSGVSKWGVMAVCAAVGVLVAIAWRRRLNAPRGRRWGARTGTVSVADKAEELCYVEKLACNAVRLTGGSVIGSAGTGSGLDAK
jgi:hypothetical protein